MLGLMMGEMMHYVVSSVAFFGVGFLAVVMPRMSCCFEVDFIILLGYKIRLSSMVDKVLGSCLLFCG